MNSALGHSGERLCRTRSAPRRTGYLLLEVVISLGLLVLGLATIGMQIQTSYDTAMDSHRMLRALHLAKSKLDELDAGLIVDVNEAIEDDLEDEFGRLFPHFGWRLRIEPLRNTPDLWLVQLQILYKYREDIEEEFDYDEMEVLYTLRTLRATPATIDPVRDFGADEEAMVNLSDALAGTDIDPYAIDLRMIGGMPVDQLIEMLTAFQEAGLFEGLDLGSMLPPEVLPLLEEAGIGDITSSGLLDGATEGQR